MDYTKIGSFIARERRAGKLTQEELAEKLYVSAKTVSKWENGKGLPDTSLLLNICGIFGVTVNELLSGERLDDREYRDRAEDNIADLLSQRRDNKRKILFSAVCCAAGFSVLSVCTAVASFLDMAAWLRICLIFYGFVIAVFGLAVAAACDVKTGSFVCGHCGKKFAPSAKEYIFSRHTFTARRLKCPFCGKVGMCKKSLQNKDGG